MFPALRYVTQGLKLIPHGILDQKIITERVIYWFTLTLTRGGSRAAATSKMECFVIIVNGCQPLTIITKRSILNVAAALDPPLLTIHCLCKSNQPLFVGNNVKERISRRVFQENKTHQVFAKTNIFYPSPPRYVQEMLVFRNIWRVLFSWNTRFEICPFVLWPTTSTHSFPRSQETSFVGTTQIFFSKSTIVK